MAVKKNELGQSKEPLNIKTLGKYILTMNQQLNYLPPPAELIQNCQNIVQCLTTAKNDDNLWPLLITVEEFLIRVVRSVNGNLRHEIITAVLQELYSAIVDPAVEAGPATSIVLIVLHNLDHEGMLSFARWLVQQGDNDNKGADLRVALSCIYSWIHEWRGTPILGDWVVAYVKALEENERFDILIEVTVEHLERLFAALNDPVSIRPAVAKVVSHVLAALRESREALDRVSPLSRAVLTSMASDTHQTTRQFLQAIVDILAAMIDYHKDRLKGEALKTFRQKHNDLFECLECHMASRGSKLQQHHQQVWRARGVTFAPLPPKIDKRKVGLLNLGNTCYMNSIMQALLVTRQFSTHVMMRMTAAPYWSKMGVLFAKMMFSTGTKLNPDEFFTIVRPPFFTVNNQHDSSEFLGYLFVLLQSYEHCSDVNFDYSRPPALTAATSRLMRNSAGQSSSSNNDYTPPVTRAASSSRLNLEAAAGPGPSSNKRALPKSEATSPPKKRTRLAIDSSFLRRDSIIDIMFGGVLVTRVECTVCHSASHSRDVFRDLQLAFPEKTETAQHSVQSLLEYYCSKESLSGDNKYQCRDCAALRDAERSVLIEKSPKYLILVLKNFKFEPKVLLQTKLIQPIFYNPTVTLPTVRNPPQHSQYSLFAAVIHNGTTLDSGHYYTLAKDNNQWHTYNDETITRSEEDDINKLHPNATPYILFYRRTDVEEGSAPTLQELPPKVQEIVIGHNKHYMDSVRSIHLSRP